ncbi:hypothetical protein ACFQX9_37885 [Bradyrhizobium sp. GCM10028915]|uniref:hypothetical protein n=1 Tax=Bradyrhizobium sp. GCM10028915 TaxID=3273385 RepID=UPI00361B5D93
MVPIFLHFWTSSELAAWLAMYAAASLVLIADGGLQLRAINRFLAFKATADCDGRSGRFYGAMLRFYLGLVAVLAIAMLICMWLLPPSAVLGFGSTPDFDAAFAVITLGTLLSLPSNLSSALYRARGCYGRAIWIQSGAMMGAQVAQLVAVVATGKLLAVAIAYALMQLLGAIYFVVVDAPRLFRFLRSDSNPPQSWRWYIGQFRLGLPFGLAGATDMVLLNAPVLLVSSFVSDRVAVAQWALTRIIAGLVRMLCLQVTLPLAAELGHDYAVGEKERLRRLYAQGSAFVSLLASAIVAGLLAFGPDFFMLWTRGGVPYDPALTIVLLLGASAAAPSILALGFANFSNRGDLLVRSKPLQLAAFLLFSIGLIPWIGPLGAAISIVASEFTVQFGILTLTVLRDTLQRPIRHVGVLFGLSLAVLATGWGLGTIIARLVPGTGAAHFMFECALWLIIIGALASPLAFRRFRERAISAIPC